MKKSKIIIIVVVILIGVFIGILCSKYADNKPRKELKLDPLIEEINKINKVFNEKFLEENGQYLNKSNYLCLRYKDDTKTLKNKLTKIYNNPFKPEGHFELIINSKDGELIYVCKPKDKKVIDIQPNMVKTIINSDTKKQFKIKGKEITFSKKNNTWKTDLPVVIYAD